MKPFYIIVAIVVVVVILYLYFYKTHTNETYTVGSPYNLIVVDENGNMSTVDIHPPALNEAHIPASTNIVYTDTSGNLGVMAYGDIGGSNRNILTVDSNNNFSVLTPPTAPSISIVSIELLNFQSPYQYTITFSVSTDPNLYPVTNYTFQANNQSIYPLKPEPDNPQIFKQQLLVVANNTSSFKVKATNAIGTGPYSDEVSKVISVPISVVIKSASNSTITLSVSRGASNPSSIKYEYSPYYGTWYNATFSSYTIESGNYTIVIKTQYNLVRSIPIIVRVTPTPGVPVTSGKFTST
jgi:hypothetical protein